MTTWEGSGCAIMLLRSPQPGRVVAGPESRGGVYDHRYGYQPGGSGAALHLLHFAQKVRSLRAIDHWLNDTSLSSLTVCLSPSFLL